MDKINNVAKAGKLDCHIISWLKPTAINELLKEKYWDLLQSALVDCYQRMKSRKDLLQSASADCFNGRISFTGALAP
jgi:hypothetical protein